MVKANNDIRQEAKKACVPLWKIADILGVGEYTIIRKLRYELPEEEKAKIRQAINEIKESEVY